MENESIDQTNHNDRSLQEVLNQVRSKSPWSREQVQEAKSALAEYLLGSSKKVPAEPTPEINAFSAEISQEINDLFNLETIEMVLLEAPDIALLKPESASRLIRVIVAAVKTNERMRAWLREHKAQ